MGKIYKKPWKKEQKKRKNFEEAIKQTAERREREKISKELQEQENQKERG